MKLSIITINYNNKQGLQLTIASILSQEWTDFEWIVVDGGSTDGSKELIEKYNDHFVWWCSEPDKGIYNAMNKGVSHAVGDYINFMNSGDCFYDEKSLLNLFGLNPQGDIIYGNAYWGLNKKYIFNSPNTLSIDYFVEGSLGHAASFILRDLLRKNPYDEKYKIVSDWKNWIIWLNEGRNFNHVDVPIACFDIEGISSINKPLDQKEREEVWHELFPDEIRKTIFQYHQCVKKNKLNPELDQIYILINKKMAYRKIVRFVKNVLLRIDKLI